MEINKQMLRFASAGFLLLAISFLTPNGVMAAGKLKLSNNSFKAGTVKEGVTINKKVTLENIGDKEIVIKNISTS